MFEKFYPDEYYDSAYSIDYKALYDKGYRGVIFDIDNTLVPHGAPADNRSISLFKQLKEIGFDAVLLSNNKEKRVAMFNEYEKAIFAVDAWSKAHPLVTNEMKFREVFGDNAANSILALHPSDIKRWLSEPYKERES